jgi:hypothetical protein
MKDELLVNCPACGSKVMQLVPGAGVCVYCVHTSTANRPPAVPKVSFWKKLFGGGGKLRKDLTNQAKHGNTLREKQLAARMLEEIDEAQAYRAANAKPKE